MIRKICLYLIFQSFIIGILPGCTNNRRITVIGKAINEKDGAIVETDSGFYFLHKVEFWNEEVSGKQVKVTGRLVYKTFKQKSTYPGEFQERVGTFRILKRPKWDLLE